jgi:hypothetical protein
MAAALGLTLLAGCAETYGPSLPAQPGKSFLAARNAVQTCLPEAPEAGRQAVVAGYIAGAVLGGVILGPGVVAVRQEHIRYSGEASGVDQCLARAGYTRRDLTPQEMIALNQSYGSDRLRLLDHLVSGGTLDNLPRQAGS